MLHQAWKAIHADDEKEEGRAAFARQLFQRIGAVYAGDGVRSPVRQWVLVDDAPDCFVAITNCGWNRLELEAWKLGWPGTHLYITSLSTMSADDIHDVYCCWSGSPCICQETGR